MVVVVDGSVIVNISWFVVCAGAEVVLTSVFVDTIAVVCALWVAVDDSTRVLKEVAVALGLDAVAVGVGVAVVVATTVVVWFGVVVGG